MVIEIIKKFFVYRQFDYCNRSE